MKVMEILNVRGREATVVIDKLPERLLIGSIVGQGSKRWRVVDIGTLGRRESDNPAELEVRDVLGSAVMPLADHDLVLIENV